MELGIFMSHFFNALTLGLLLALIASGLTIIFGFLNIINFGHGALYMLGAYLGYQIYHVTGSFTLAILLASVIMGIVGLLLQRYVLIKLSGKSPVYVVLFTFGFALFIENLTRIIWGPNMISVSPPSMLSGSITIGYPFPVYRLFLIVFCSIVLLGVYFLLTKTKIGIIVRAGTEDEETASVLGVNVKLIGVGVFAAGTALAALAGVVTGPYLTLEPHMGMAIIIDAFIVLVIGGMTSFAGTIVAGLAIGFLQVFGGIYFSELTIVFTLTLMILVIIKNPKGLGALFNRMT
ncbi:branched-chain amino acid ABC transporter permease [Pueribacillus sp. YX66]|uniref:branched-chain amino acid ABC transporter permease n=1 Tax=Pueribacillus sp. YX66 TaxID=3229242 RepID=UPI00358D3BE2